MFKKLLQIVQEAFEDQFEPVSEEELEAAFGGMKARLFSKSDAKPFFHEVQAMGVHVHVNPITKMPGGMNNWSLNASYTVASPYRQLMTNAGGGGLDPMRNRQIAKSILGDKLLYNYTFAVSGEGTP